jgi:hypothetical protein
MAGQEQEQISGDLTGRQTNQVGTVHDMLGRGNGVDCGRWSASVTIETQWLVFGGGGGRASVQAQYVARLLCSVAQLSLVACFGGA